MYVTVKKLVKGESAVLVKPLACTVAVIVDVEQKKIFFLQKQGWV